MLINTTVCAAIFGIDLGKSVFHVARCTSTGQPVQRLRLTRDKLLAYFANTPAGLVGMEACPGSQWLARKLTEFGHQVRIIPAQFVKPYVKSNKNDALDAEAIAEAVTRPTMRFVQLKTCDQIDLQALHRVRSQAVGNRTALINQIRAFALEYGIAMRHGVGVFKLDIVRVLSDQDNALTPAMRTLLAGMWDEFKRLDARAAELGRQIQDLAAGDARAKRLMSIPGIGALGATALLAAIGNGKQFRSGRDFAAWLGLVPRQATTGGKPTLLGMSKRGNTYLRKLLVHGARSCLLHTDRSRDRLGVWIEQLASRMHHNKVTVAMANKMARIAWKLLQSDHAVYLRRPPIPAAV